jgi:hypothetical protein
MPEIPDELLFDFDKKTHLAWDQAESDRHLAKYPELYRNHLAIGRLLSLHASRLEANAEGMVRAESLDAMVDTLRDVAADLRYGAFLPGSSRFDELVTK